VFIYISDRFWDFFRRFSNYFQSPYNGILNLKISFESFFGNISYIFFNLFYAFFSIPAGKLSDIIGRKVVLAFGFLLFGLTALGFAFIANNFTIWILFALYGLFMAITDGVSRAYVSDLTVKEERGTTLGAYHTIVGITVLPANFIGGMLWHKINVFAPFIYAAVLSIIAALLLVVLVKRK